MKKIILNCLIIVSLVLAFAVVANAENNITIYVNEQALQCDVEPYAENGRTFYVPNSEVKAHQNVGWYKSKTEADAAGAKSYSSSNSSQTSTSQSNNNNRSNSGGSAVYRTPSGKRYHFDPDCGGKNSFGTTLQNAKSAGLTPCQKCAY